MFLEDVQYDRKVVYVLFMCKIYGITSF